VTVPIDLVALAERLTTIESIAWMPRVTSTNTLARMVARECVENEIQMPRAMIIAAEQTGGRGRGSRSWSSPAGKGIWATTLYTVPTGQLAYLPLRIATVVASFLREAFAVDAKIKWPNDILVGGKKIAGILIEGRNQDADAWVMIGVGINVLPSNALPDTAVSVADASKLDRIEVVDATIAFVEYFDRELGREPDPAEIIDAWRALASHRRGDRVSCTVGDKLVEGTWLDIDDDGRALIRKGEETIVVAAGDVIAIE
jgi:BirA family transcriptional regulator, biotin operon repressor / biotin---[acetyl-CoA-carboxylase] ligase